MKFPGATIFALEREARRAARLEENLRAREVEAQVLVEDAVDWLEQGGRPFDLLLLDAPCSASGTFRKHPELPWIGQLAALPRLVKQQRRLLQAALARLAPGGLLVYAVCSWFPEEGFLHRDWALDTHPRLEGAPVWADSPGLPGDATRFRTPPLVWDGEGFQAFALTVKGSGL